MSFGKEVKIRRVILGITQKELAERIGVGQTMISAYENDMAKPGYDQLIALSNVFKCSIDELVRGNGKFSVCLDVSGT